MNDSRGHWGYNPPPILFTRKQLASMYSRCGVFEHHDCCLRCGQPADVDHRLNWFACTEPCLCCSGSGVHKKRKHIGKPCAQQEKSYGNFFTVDFFESHAGVRSRPWYDNFHHKYKEVRYRLRPSKGKGLGPKRKQMEQSKPLPKPKPSKTLDDTDEEELFQDFVTWRKDRKRAASPSFDPSSVDNTNRGREHKRQAKACYKCGNPEHLIADCPKISCSHCFETGHKAEDCPLLTSDDDEPRPRRKAGPLVDVDAMDVDRDDASSKPSSTAQKTAPLPKADLEKAQKTIAEQQATIDELKAKLAKSEAGHEETLVALLKTTKLLEARDKEIKKLRQSNADNSHSEFSVKEEINSSDIETEEDGLGQIKPEKF